MEGARKPLILLALLGIGCHGKVDVPYPTYAPAPTPYVPNAGSGNAFDAYVLAAGEAETAVAGFKIAPLGRSFFTPTQRTDLLKALAPALRRIESARGSCDFRYVPARPGAPLPGRAAWRLLGHALRWRIDDALLKGDPAAAIASTAVAMRFGNDLCGGGPADRTLGVEIAEDARQALLPALATLDSAGLRSLADAVKAGLSRRPPLTKTLEGAEADMALALQTFMESYRSGEYGPFRTALGRDFRDLESPMAEMKKKDGPARAAFFDGLDEDRRNLSLAWRTAAALPASNRAKLLAVKLKNPRERKVFARHFFLVGKPLLEIEDRSVARLRLLVLEAELRRLVRLTRRAPTSLAAVKPPWAIDPYDGRTFGYQPDGAEYRVYSVGTNLKDDLGDTDAAGLEPDIRTVVP